jgi:PhnB protein
MAVVHPYLNFPGTCGEAFDFYKSVFGGEFGMRMTFDNSPPEFQGAKEDAKKIMHVSLPIGSTVLMGSDRPASIGSGSVGDSFSVSIHADSKEEADRLFNGLSAGGKVIMPLSDTFWGSYFGMWADKFGVQWMMSFDKANKH